MGVEQVVADSDEGFSGHASGSAEEVEEHEEAVGGFGGLKGSSESVFGDGSGFEVAELWHTRAFDVEHPDHVAEDGFFDDCDGEEFGHAVVADEGGDEEVAEVGAGGFGGAARDEVVNESVLGGDEVGLRGAEAEEEVEEGEVGFYGFFGGVG